MTTGTTFRLDGAIAGLAIKAPCKVQSTANLTLSGTQTVNSVAVVAGDRVLVKDQTTATENGIYTVSTTAWTRALDFDGNRDVTQGTICPVYSGSGTYSLYAVSNANPITIDTTSISFETIDSASLLEDLAASSGSSLVGDDTGGVLWTTVKGFITYLLSSAGSSVLGFIQSGTGATARTVQSKLRDEVNVFDFMTEAQIAQAVAGTLTDASSFFNLATAALSVSRGTGAGSAALKGGLIRVSNGQFPCANVKLPYWIKVKGTLGFQGELETSGKGSVITCKTSGSPAFIVQNSSSFEGLSFENYHSTGSHVLYQDDAGNEQGLGVEFKNCSYQGGDTAVEVIAFGDLKFDGCHFHGHDGDIIKFGGSQTSFAYGELILKDCLFNGNPSAAGYTTTKAVAVTGSGNTINGVLIQSSKFTNFDNASSVVLDIQGGGAIQIDGGCIFDNVNGIGVQVTGGQGIVSEGNFFNSVTTAHKFIGTTDYRVGPNKYVTVTTEVNADTASIGDKFNERNVAWTPALLFGGAAVGMTGTFTGNYTKIKNVVILQAEITLTAKGSSTGAATITGLPYTVRNSLLSYAPGGTMDYANMASIGVGGAYVRATFNTTTLELMTGSATDSASMSQGNFTDTSQIRFTAVVFI